MGYYTDYVVTLRGPIEQLAKLRALAEDEDDGAFLDFYELGEWSGNAKWYDWEENLTEWSRECPDVLIHVKGEGEENEDVWVAWVKNGRVERQEPTLIWPPTPSWVTKAQDIGGEA